MECSLSSGEGQGKVFSALHWVKSGIVKRVWEEFVDEGTKGHAAAPAGGKVLDIYMLGMRKRKVNGDGFSCFLPSRFLSQLQQIVLTALSQLLYIKVAPQHSFKLFRASQTFITEIFCCKKIEL